MSEQSTRIGIIGVGSVGSALAVSLSRSGYDVKLGVRAGKDVSELLSRCGERASAVPVKEAADWAEVVFLAVPAGVAVEVAASLGELSGKVVVDCNNPLRWDAGPVWDPPAEGSLAQAIAKALPRARVVKAFNTFGAEFHEDPSLGDTGADVPLCADDAEAKQLVSAIAERVGFTPIDVGPLRNASVLENVAMMWIHLALVGGKGRSFAFKLIERR